MASVTKLRVKVETLERDSKDKAIEIKNKLESLEQKVLRVEEVVPEITTNKLETIKNFDFRDATISKIE